MTPIQALFLGIIQGLTEFLPISSSGHLALLHNFFQEQSLAFDISIHFATLLAIVTFFIKDIINIIKDFFTLKIKSDNFKLVIYLILASIPAGIIGFLINAHIESIFSNLYAVSLGFFVSGFFLLSASFVKKKNKKLNIKNTFLIGISQALAIFPGISRSGTTVSTGLLSGIKRENSIKFSFLLAIPAILGANLLKISEIASLNLSILAIGFISAFFSGLLAIFIFIKYLKISNLKYLAIYCLLLAILSLFLGFFA